MSDIEKTLPPSVGRSRGIGAILRACGGELEALEREARAGCLRLSAGQTDAKGAALWERELGLEERDDLSIGARRALILSALNARGTCTAERIRSTVGQLLEGETDVEELPGSFRVAVHVRATALNVPDLRTVERMLRQLVPAHLAETLSVDAGLQTSDGPGRALFSGVKLRIYTTKEEAT